LIGLKEIAETFNKTYEGVRSAVASLKSYRKGRKIYYSLAEVKPIMEKLISRSKKPASQQELERKKLELQCEKLRVEIDERKKNLLPAAEVARHFQTFAGSARSHLLKQPGEIAAILEGLPVAKIEKELERHNLGLLAKLADTVYT